LHKFHSLRRSFLHFYFISAVHIWFISYIINKKQRIVHGQGTSNIHWSTAVYIFAACCLLSPVSSNHE